MTRRSIAFASVAWQSGWQGGTGVDYFQVHLPSSQIDSSLWLFAMTKCGYYSCTPFVIYLNHIYWHSMSTICRHTMLKYAQYGDIFKSFTDNPRRQKSIIPMFPHFTAIDKK